MERARSFVEAYGTVLARERFARLADGAPPERVEAVLGAWRCADGGFVPASEPPPLLPGSGSVRGVLEALAIFDEAGIRRGERIEGAVAWLARHQRADGSWQEGLDGGGADPLYLTGMLAGHLSKLGCGSARVIARAEAFLGAHFRPERVEDGDWHLLTAYAHVCTNGSFELADEALQWCGRALEKGFRSGRLDALDVARTLLVCDVHALPASRVDATAALLALLPGQAPDGSFGAPGLSTAARVDATLLAAHALVRFGTKGAPWTVV